MAIAIGSVLKGQYRIDALIGGGGMAMVYRAFDLNLQRVCAIKQNLDTSPEAQRQFHVEAIVLANLSHHHLSRVTDHFLDTTGQQYLVMDFVEGENLQDYVMRTGPLSERQALAWMSGVIDALEYCHQQGVIHRDIKPANLVKRHGQDTVVLVDFGIAKQQVSGSATLTGARAASPAFAPPEQFSGHTDARSDIYSMGGTLYFLLTERTPPDARLVMAGVETAVPPRAIDSRISPSTDQAIMRALAVRMNDRPASVAEFKRLLLPAVPPPARGPRLSWIVAVLALLALIALAALTLPRLLKTNGEVATALTPTLVPVTTEPSSTAPFTTAAASSTPLLPSTVVSTIQPVGTPGASGGIDAFTPTQLATVQVTTGATSTITVAYGETRVATSTPVVGNPAVTPNPSQAPTGIKPTATPASAASTPTSRPRPVAVVTPCPSYLYKPKPGMGLLLIENHLGEPMHIDNAANGDKWDMAPKQGDIPARLVLDLAPGSYTFVDNTAAGFGRISVTITAGSAFVSPLWYNDRTEELVYPLEIPNGCK